MPRRNARNLKVHFGLFVGIMGAMVFAGEAHALFCGKSENDVQRAADNLKVVVRTSIPALVDLGTKCQEYQSIKAWLASEKSTADSKYSAVLDSVRGLSSSLSKCDKQKQQYDLYTAGMTVESAIYNDIQDRLKSLSGDTSSSGGSSGSVHQNGMDYTIVSQGSSKFTCTPPSSTTVTGTATTKPKGGISKGNRTPGGVGNSTATTGSSTTTATTTRPSKSASKNVCVDGGMSKNYSFCGKKYRCSKWELVQ